MRLNGKEVWRTKEETIYAAVDLLQELTIDEIIEVLDKLDKEVQDQIGDAFCDDH